MKGVKTNHQLTVVRGHLGTPAFSHAADEDVEALLGEQFYLQDPRGPDGPSAFKVRDADGEVVAYIDSDGHLRHKGMVLPLSSLP